MAKPPPGTSPLQQANTYQIPHMNKHILLCAGPDCTDPAAGDAAWAYLKKRIAELQLHLPPTGLFRTKCHCLRICTQGPILVVQPDGVWYHSATPPVIERILHEHLLQKKIVSEFVITTKPLPPENT